MKARDIKFEVTDIYNIKGIKMLSYQGFLKIALNNNFKITKKQVKDLELKKIYKLDIITATLKYVNKNKYSKEFNEIMIKTLAVKAALNKSERFKKLLLFYDYTV